jgi:NTP pyrophosphatase (non-canonical NTP hydrolase)
MSRKSFQQRVEEWLAACFPPAARANRDERTHRFLEEALELAQANGCSRQNAQMLVDYVYSRPEGRPEDEVGGVLVTLASLCSATQIDMNDEGDRELERNWERIDTIRQKQASKPHGSPLPQ